MYIKLLLILLSIVLTREIEAADWSAITGKCVEGKEIILKSGTRVKMMTEKSGKVVIEEITLKRDRKGILIECENGVYAKLHDCGNLVVISEKRVATEKEKIIVREQEPVERPSYSLPFSPPPPPPIVYAPPPPPIVYAPPPPQFSPPIILYFNRESYRYNYNHYNYYYHRPYCYPPYPPKPPEPPRPPTVITHPPIVNPSQPPPSQPPKPPTVVTRPPTVNSYPGPSSPRVITHSPLVH
jgi:hypothetical protein